VVLSNVTDIPRIEALQQRGVEVLATAETDSIDANPANDSASEPSDDLPVGAADDSTNIGD